MTKLWKVALAFLVAGLALGSFSVVAAPARAASVSYDLYGSLAHGWGFTSSTETNPGPTLKLTVGDTVTINLHSTDGFPHRFLIDLNGNGLADAGEPLSPAFTSTATLVFTVTQAGTYGYICTIHGSAMAGPITAQGTSTPAPVATSGTSMSTEVIVGVLVAIVAIAAVSVAVLRSRN